MKKQIQNAAPLRITYIVVSHHHRTMWYGVWHGDEGRCLPRRTAHLAAQWRHISENSLPEDANIESGAPITRDTHSGRAAVATATNTKALPQQRAPSHPAVAAVLFALPLRNPYVVVCTRRHV